MSGIFTILEGRRLVSPACSVHVTVYTCVQVCVHSLLGLGGNQQPQGATDAEGLGDHGFHLREGPEEQQVLVDGEDLPAYLQAGHLEGQAERQERKHFYF